MAETIEYMDILKDPEVIDMLDLDEEYTQLLNHYTQDDFLKPDESLSIPFFATIRDYIGARDPKNPGDEWIIKKIKTEEDLIQHRMAMVAYFINVYTKTLSAPSIVTCIDGEYYRASKVMKRTEQLSGAPYLEFPNMRNQLAVDLLNSWIFFDEDRNPNNYLIYYTKKGFPVIISIDFSNVDLISEEMKVTGSENAFGWQRTGKTRYMTPLKTELFFEYSYDFFEPRFEAFKKLNAKTINSLLETIFRDNCDEACQADINKIAKNLKSRVEYVHDYFKNWFDNPENLQKMRKKTREEMKDEYSIMGKTFNNLSSLK